MKHPHMDYIARDDQRGRLMTFIYKGKERLRGLEVLVS